ncbi:LysR family transcriptional regulator [Cupriavidus sp. 30B13]|uniref:LysR family transcriptional regulator n=1 Tax=Cupriavidus sp. 30B13 TaxID=3384241 RepID=UPI003B8F9301
MEITHLRALLAVIESGTLSKAADSLGLTQPAVSRQIRLLEEELGEALFFRHGRGMTPTDAAQRIAFRAAAGLREFDAISSEIAEARSAPSGTVRLGMTPTVAELTIVPLTAIISRRFPDIRLRFSTAFSGYLLDWIHRDEVDLGVLYDPSRHHSLSVEPLLSEELVLVGGAHRKLSLAQAQPFASLTKERLLLPGPRHGIRRAIERTAEELGVQFEVAIEADSFPVLKDLVAAGHGTTILPYNSVRAEVAQARFSATRIAPELRRQLVLARPAASHQSTAARAVCAVLVEFLVAEVDSGRLAADVLVDAKRFRGRI